MPWETGCLIRLGKIQGSRRPGWYWVWPFIDDMVTIESNQDLFITSQQTIDGVTFEMVGSAQVVDVCAYYRELNDSVTVSTATVVMAEMAKAMEEQGWKHATPELLRKAKARSRRKLKKLGLRLRWLQFRTVTDSQVLRLLTDSRP